LDSDPDPAKSFESLGIQKGPRQAKTRLTKRGGRFFSMYDAIPLNDPGKWHHFPGSFSGIASYIGPYSTLSKLYHYDQKRVQIQSENKNVLFMCDYYLLQRQQYIFHRKGDLSRVEISKMVF
jgi:hypothetical protein